MFQIIRPGTTFDFVGKRRFFVYMSSILNVVVLAGVLIFGLNYGIDFSGGTTLRVRLDAPADKLSAVTSAGVEEVVKSLGLPSPEVQRVGTTGNQFLIMLKKVVSDINQTHLDKIKANLGLVPAIGADGVRRVEFAGEGGDRINIFFAKDVDETVIQNAVQAAGISEFELVKRGREGESREFVVKVTSLGNRVKTAIAAKYAVPATLESSEAVGPRAGDKLRADGVKSLVFALLGILFYVGFRFDFRYAPGAVLATLHDVILTTGFYLVTRLEFNLSSIAALLTIIGYSVNDTVIVYDRIRENQARLRDKRLDIVVNISTNETLSRTILTSGATALSMIAVPFVATGSIRDFALALLVGIAIGTYSSIYVASPMVIWLDEKIYKRRRAAGAAAAPLGRRAAKKVEEEEEEDEGADEASADSESDEGDEGGDDEDDERR
jgi:preprotein translocase subunit SecF